MSSFWSDIKNWWQYWWELIVPVGGLILTLICFLVIVAHIQRCEYEEVTKTFATDSRTKALFRRIDSLLITDNEKYLIKRDAVRRIKREEAQTKRQDKDN